MGFMDMLKESYRYAKTPQAAPVVREDGRSLVKVYLGSQNSAAMKFKTDSVKMEQQGYLPISQSWSPGSYGCSSFIAAILLCIIIGFIFGGYFWLLVFFYMLIIKPHGNLTVAYARPTGYVAEEG